MTPCPCGSTRPYALCCGAYIAGARVPTAQALMRSRYSAYVVGDLDYLQKTSAGQALLAFDRAEVSRSLPGTEWLGLDVLETEAGEESDDTGTVTFRARFRQGGRIHTIAERSEFRRVGGEWRYVRGEVDEGAPAGARQVGRNDPCPCGSGKKFKKCHGA